MPRTHGSIVGHPSLVFAKYLVNGEARRRIGVRGRDTPAFASVPCTGEYSVSEITATLGSGEGPGNTLAARSAV
jgi:hypothetical protein